MAHGQGATSTKKRGRGKRAHGTDPNVKKYENRERDERVQAALEETRRQQSELDALIERQKSQPALGVVAGAMHAEERRKAEAALAAAQAAEEQARAEAEVESEVEEPGIEIEITDSGITISPKFSTRKLKQKGEGDFPFAIMTARFMFKAGYHAEHVIATTGVGWEEISDISHDPDGYGNADRLKREAEAEKELCDECRTEVH